MAEKTEEEHLDEIFARTLGDIIEGLRKIKTGVGDLWWVYKKMGRAKSDYFPARLREYYDKVFREETEEHIE